MLEQRTIRIPKDLSDLIKARAKKNSRTFSQEVRYIINQWLRIEK